MINRRKFLKTAGGLAIASADGKSPVEETAPAYPRGQTHGDYAIGVYYFHNYHVDPKNERAHGNGWTEWELLKRAEPKFPGHRQPKVPLWGYEDESAPKVFERKIKAAAEHGIHHFIFDWYWYEDEPFLHRGLESGYMKAANNDQLQFALMWANHDWTDIQPKKLDTEAKLLFPGKVTRRTFEKMTDYVIEKYFRHPSHWKVNGAPYFSIYELYRLIDGLGGLEATKEALASFRAKTKQAGFLDLHLNAVIWGVRILPGEQTLKSPNEVLLALGFSSITSYTWIHHVPLPDFPVTPYSYVVHESVKHWEQTVRTFDIPYHPNVSMGWDSSPRTVQSDVYTNKGYPFMAILAGNTPAAFKNALVKVRSFLDNRKVQPKTFTINAWNEWTEGSYLEPDTVNGMAYLQAIREVFPPA